MDTTLNEELNTNLAFQTIQISDAVAGFVEVLVLSSGLKFYHFPLKLPKSIGCSSDRHFVVAAKLDLPMNAFSKEDEG